MTGVQTCALPISIENSEKKETIKTKAMELNNYTNESKENSMLLYDCEVENKGSIRSFTVPSKDRRLKSLIGDTANLK